MKIAIKHINLNKLNLFIILIGLFVTVYLLPYPNFWFSLIILISSINFLSHFKNISLYKNSPIIITLTFLALNLIYILITPEALSIYNPYSKIFYILYIVVGLSTYIAGYYDRITHNQLYIFGLAIWIICIIREFSILLIINSGTINKLDKLFTDFYQIIPYFILWTVPFLFLKKTKINYILIAISAIALLVSAKRGPIVAFSIAMLFFYITNTKFNIRKLVGILIALLITLYVINTYFESELNNFFLRWENDFDEGSSMGSGRTNIWETVLTDWSKGDLFNLFFGKGFESSHELLYNETGYAISAHNDWIDILYNFGISGIIIFAAFNAKLILYVKKMFSDKYIHRNTALMLVTMWFIVSIISCNTYKLSTILFSVLFFWLIGNYNRNIKAEAKEQRILKHTII